MIHFKSFIKVILIVLVSISCNTVPFEKTIYIHDSFFTGYLKLYKTKQKNKYCLALLDTNRKIIDRIYTPYEVFQMEAGDVNHDKKLDVCLGIIKPTPFDSVLKKRLFIFQIDSGYIRPLWLSSRLVNPLECFRVIQKPENTFIRTIEKQGKENYCVREYNWESFGMTYKKTLNDTISIDKALTILNQIQ